MLIDKTYFIGNIWIPNLNEPEPDNTFSERLKWCITKAEEEVLCFAFGLEMWQDFKEKYSANPQSLPQNYQEILTGKSYRGKKGFCHWQGLIQPGVKTSLLADYAFVLYQIENARQSTEFGPVTVETKIGTPVSISPKITRVYNDFLEKLQGGVKGDPTGLTFENRPYWWLPSGGVDYHGVYDRGGKISLMRFLLDHQGDFPLLARNFRVFGTLQNEFGI